MSGAAKKPSRLGMGLSALIGDLPGPAAPAAAAGGAPRSLPVEALEPGPFQARGPIDEESLRELAASIREHGVLQPILVRPAPGRPGAHQIIGGERRWRAAQLAQLHEVPVVVRELDDSAAMAAGLVENLQREDLNAVEEAEGYTRLIEQFGMKQEALAQAVGKSRSHVANTLRLMNLPDPVKELVRKGQLSAGHARALLVAEDPARLAATVVTRGLSVRQVEAMVAARPREGGTRGARKDPDTAALERELGDRLGLKVQIRPAGKGGQVTIAYRDLDQLDGLIRLLMPGAG